MKNIISAALFWLICCQLTAQSLVTIKGIITNPQSKLVSVDLLKSPLSDDMTSYGGHVGELGNFTIQLELEKPTLAAFFHAGQYMHIFLEPNDDIFITADAAKLERTIRCSGKGSGVNRNNWLFDYELRFNSQNAIADNNRKVRTLKADKYKLFVDAIRKDKLSFWQTYQSRNAASSNFREFVTAKIDGEWGNKLLDYPFAHTIANNLDDMMVMPPSYYSFMSEVFVNNADVLNYPMHQEFLLKYITKKFKQEVSPHSYTPQTYYAERYEFIGRCLSGEPKYYAQARAILDACTYGKVESVASKCEDFINNTPNPNYVAAVKKVYGGASKLAAGQAAPNFVLYDLNNKQISLNDLRGKVVYLDFWATWCGPCVREIPHSQELINRFKGRSVEFVYISVDENPIVWGDYVKSKIPHGVNLIAYGLQSEVSKMYNIKGVPKYMIIDKNGIIVDSNAKRPSEFGIVNDLESALYK